MMKKLLKGQYNKIKTKQTNKQTNKTKKKLQTHKIYWKYSAYWKTFVYQDTINDKKYVKKKEREGHLPGYWQ